MMQRSKVVVFDLDDTLYKEIDFLKSAYRHIASLISNTKALEEEMYQLMLEAYLNRENAFETVVQEYRLRLFSVEWMLGVYRNHKPKIALDDDTKNTLDELKKNGVILGIVTDGRLVQQQNKIDSLGLSKYMDVNDIIVNEEEKRFKPDQRSFLYFMNEYGDACDYWFIGDNTNKDFLAPNSHGWTTVCLLDDGRNIHKQCFDIDSDYLPKYKVSKISGIRDLL